MTSRTTGEAANVRLRSEPGSSVPKERPATPASSLIDMADCIRGAIVVAVTVLSLAAPVPARAQTAGDGTDHLAAGIGLYRAGRFDEALRELNDHIRVMPDSPLAYYYAARIRIEMGQYSRAGLNLEAALADSAGFADARGLLALTLLREGRGDEALGQWRRFTDAVGRLDGSGAQAVTDIVDPEDYRKALADATAERERQRLLAEELARQQREKERLAREVAEEESIRVAAEEQARMLAATESAAADPVPDVPDMAVVEGTEDEAPVAAPPAPSLLPGARVAETPEPAMPADGGGEDDGLPAPLEDLTTQIGADVRRGAFTLLAVLVVLAAGIGGTSWWFRRRRLKKQVERVFSDEVGRLLDVRDMGLSEDEAELEFESKRRELLERTPAGVSATAASSPEAPAFSGLGEKAAQPSGTTVAGADELPAGVVSSRNGSRTSSITDEVKSLVSRLHREGKTPEEIALTADLTTTEVRLILAVREHRVAAIAEELQGEDEPMDRTVLLKAVDDLLAEGATTRDIARQLGVSLSEVSLAASIITMRGQSPLFRSGKGPKA